MGPNAKLTRAFPSLCSYTDLHTHQKDCFSLAQKVWDTRLGVGNKGWKRSRMRRWIVFFCRGIKFSKREKGICSTIPVFLGLPWNLSQTCTGNFCMKCGRHTQTHTNTQTHRHTDTQTHRHTDTHTHTHTHCGYPDTHPCNRVWLMSQLNRSSRSGFNEQVGVI